MDYKEFVDLNEIKCPFCDGVLVIDGLYPRIDNGIMSVCSDDRGFVLEKIFRCPKCKTNMTHEEGYSVSMYDEIKEYVQNRLNYLV
jgi:hypothetical protein